MIVVTAPTGQIGSQFLGVLAGLQSLDRRRDHTRD
jgi:hypothetical protein